MEFNFVLSCFLSCPLLLATLFLGKGSSLSLFGPPPSGDFRSRDALTNFLVTAVTFRSS